MNKFMIWLYQFNLYRQIRIRSCSIEPALTSWIKYLYTNVRIQLWSITWIPGKFYFIYKVDPRITNLSPEQSSEFLSNMLKCSVSLQTIGNDLSQQGRSIVAIVTDYHPPLHKTLQSLIQNKADYR